MKKGRNFKIGPDFAEIFISNIVNTKYTEEGLLMTVNGTDGEKEENWHILYLDPFEVARATRDYVLLSSDINAQKLGYAPNFSNYTCKTSQNSNIIVTPEGDSHWEYVIGLPILYDTVVNELCKAPTIIKFQERVLQKVNPGFSFKHDAKISAPNFSKDLNFAL